MAIQGSIPVQFEAFFPKGAAIISDDFEPVAQWSEEGQNVGQQYDKATEKPLWSVQVIDLDPNARKGQSEVTVKVASATKPTVPPALPGLSLRPALFEGLSITPYVKENGGRPRVAYSLRAVDVKAAGPKRSE